MTKFINANKFFQWSEFIVSKQFPAMAKKIKITQSVMDNISYWVDSCGDAWRFAHSLNPIIINSAIRSDELNNALGGSVKSDHVYGFAIDSYVVGMSAKEYFCSIIDMNLPYRQLILYPDKKFVHWSLNLPGRSYKHQTIVM